MRKKDNINLSDYLYADEAECVEALLESLDWDDSRAQDIEASATELVEAMRARKAPMGQLESFLQQYSLNTAEGLALMCLAEALLRVPDKKTANALIKDKIAAANWLDAAGKTDDWIVKAAGVGLLMTSKTLGSALSRLSQPIIREAMIKAMRIMGHQFVLGRDIEEAMKNSAEAQKKGYRISYDMLGEGARTAKDAQRYFDSYKDAIEKIGAQKHEKRAGISVKLSALHPRYEYAQRAICIPALCERLDHLVRMAHKHNITITVDAEEVDRLEMSLEIIEHALEHSVPEGWDGFGLAVQAYQKRALPLIDRLAAMAKTHNRTLQIRLVKGAYWDTEIKRAQVEGLPDFPVFSRKSNTDLSYLACAQKMLTHKDHIFPMFGTHNAHTVSAVWTMALEAGADFEFQRLHGMGESLYSALKEKRDVPVTIYAPVGSHEDLLPYLVRRLLENGANSSFVNKVLDRDVPVKEVIRDPVKRSASNQDKYHPNIRLPHELYKNEPPYGRINSSGRDLTDADTAQHIEDAIAALKPRYESYAFINAQKIKDSVAHDIRNPADRSQTVGQVWPAHPKIVNDAFKVAKESFKEWNAADSSVRATALENIADLFERHYDELIALCTHEAGKTISDGVAEVREAIDFCRYYANKGRDLFNEVGEILPGPTGEDNRLHLSGRGVFVCISPWNFPLAIFTGQITAALMAGNAVIAKPAEQTPLIAMRAVQLMHEAGIPPGVVTLLPGDGRLGAALIEHKDVAGVAFTGSTEVAHEINKTLAAKQGAITPLIAETGGQNVMIVDSTALTEQVIDDVVLSAFGSAGQRCSALRVLCLQDEIADKTIEMLKGAMAEQHVGNPALIASDIGPVIDEAAMERLMSHRKKLDGFGTLIHEMTLDATLIGKGHFFAPCAFEIENIGALGREIFGPILHVVRFKSSELDELIDAIKATGYGLTFGVHSRIDSFQRDIARRVGAGNTYVNRSMTGAVVGVQPFGGHGLSGTGPKAGGPYYLPRFSHEHTVSVDTTAAGGNASLVSLEE